MALCRKSSRTEMCSPGDTRIEGHYKNSSPGLRKWNELQQKMFKDKDLGLPNIDFYT